MANEVTNGLVISCNKNTYTNGIQSWKTYHFIKNLNLFTHFKIQLFSSVKMSISSDKGHKVMLETEI